jgi:hypothetical protein
MAVAFVACGGGNDAPVPPAQRFVTAADAPGTKPDPVEKRETTADLDEFFVGLREGLIDPDEDEMTAVFREGDFKRAGRDARFYGATHSPTARHVFSSFVELDSKDGAKRALEWFEADAMKPCPDSCATRINRFDVDVISDALGVHRIATAKDIKAAGTKDEVPHSSYWVGFTEGSIVYTIDLSGQPGSVSEKQAERIAQAYRDRLTGG